MSAFRSHRKKPRILVVTPECASLPVSMGRICAHPFSSGSGTGEGMAGIVSGLYDENVDVHLAFPDYCAMLRRRIDPEFIQGYDSSRIEISQRVHRAQDRIFYYAGAICYSNPAENARRALAFQREVIHEFLPRIRPDLVHCVGAMTGLVPAVARSLRIPSIFTLDGIDTAPCTLEEMENRGIDPGDFWKRLYYAGYPGTYEQCRSGNPVDLKTSGVFSASWVHAFSSSQLGAILDGALPSAGPALRQQLADKIRSRRVAAIPPPSGPNLNEAGETSPARQFTPFYDMVRLYETALGRPLFSEKQPFPAEPVEMMRSA
ncbi:MAG: glycogen/starch synthase [Desulfobacterales bacterium]|nr:glycogen/starch synthase [Desulfobacterales bacterium]